jgi:hypothetical protein
MLQQNLYKADLHNHGYITQERGKFSFERRPKDLKTLVDICIKNDLDITAVTNFSDDRYSTIRETAKQLPNNYLLGELKENNKSIALIIIKDDRPMIIVRGQEIPTSEGHILTVGAPNNIRNGKSLKDTIKEAKDLGAIVIADHPFTPKIRGGIGERNLLKYLEQLDAIEIVNAQNIIRKYDKQAKKFAKEHKKPGIAVSDAHLTEDIGLAYIYFYETLDFTSGRGFIDSLKDTIITERFNIEERYTTFYKLMKWHTILAYNLFRRKIGLLPNTNKT